LEGMVPNRELGRGRPEKRDHRSTLERDRDVLTKTRKDIFKGVEKSRKKKKIGNHRRDVSISLLWKDRTAFFRDKGRHNSCRFSRPLT